MRKLPPVAQLRAFEAAARHMSFKKAAEELAVTPTAISHQIRALEAHVGQPLFRRRPRPLTLTDVGTRLFPGVKDGFDKFSAALSTIDDTPSADTTTSTKFASRRQEQEPSWTGSSAFPPDKPVVAVLPFINLSGDPGQEYFSDGLSEDIITLLSAWRSFPVVSRHSSFAFKNQTRDVRQIARDLSARYIIEGSVRKAGNRIRVSAQLVDTETGHHLWAEKFDGVLDDIFEIQDELTRRIVSSVEPEMEKAERNLAATKRASNLSAWDYYLRGRELLHKLTPSDNAQARAMFERAIKLDRAYGDAHAGLSYTYQMDILLEVCDNRATWEGKALELARKAVSLDGASSIAHFALSGAYIWLNQHQLAIAETRTAAELNPSNGHVWLALGNRLDIVGQSDEGIPLLERSLQLHLHDPHSHIYFAQLARAYINAQEYDKALDYLHESIRCQPDYPHTYHVLAICLGHLGRIEDAREAAYRCEELHPGFIKRRANWNIYVDPAANQHLTDGLRKAGLVE